jgi:iron complex transport system substrate-binding protein
MRIVSCFPAATEIACALGLEESLVGVSHECGFPPSVRSKPVVVRSALSTAGLRPVEVDRAVAERIGTGRSLYVVDEERLRALRPDVILTQDLCQVCAPSGTEASRAVATLPAPPRVVLLTPRTLEDVWRSVEDVGAACGVPERAAALVASLRGRVAAIRARVPAAPVRRTFVLEWYDPPWASGHWVPEMVELAGGRDELGAPGGESVRVPWDRIATYAPDVLVLAPCGLPLEDALAQAAGLRELPGWDDLPAVRAGRVFVTDASAYLARPGPRLADGLGMLAEILHPEACRGLAPRGSYARLTPPIGV